MAAKRLLFEAWRGIHHSYALVAQQHCHTWDRVTDRLLAEVLP